MDERRESVNDMYTQTGRAGRKEGKTPRKTKRERGEEERGGRGTGRKKTRRRRNSRLKCLGSSDDSQSSCLLASRFPFPSTPPAVCVRTSFLSLSLSLRFLPPLSPSPTTPPPSPSLCQSLLFVAHAPMRNKHCSKIVSPARTSPPCQARIRYTTFLMAGNFFCFAK